MGYLELADINNSINVFSTLVRLLLIPRCDISFSYVNIFCNLTNPTDLSNNGVKPHCLTNH